MQNTILRLQNSNKIIKKIKYGINGKCRTTKNLNFHITTFKKIKKKHNLLLKLNVSKGSFKNTKYTWIKSINRIEPRMIQIRPHTKGYNRMLNKWSNIVIQHTFYLSTVKKLQTFTDFNLYSKKNIRMNYDIYIVIGFKVIGMMKIIFVDSDKPIFYWNKNCIRDLTNNSILLATESKIIGYIQTVFKPAELITRSLSPFNEIFDFQLPYLQNLEKGSLNNFIIANFKARLRRRRKIQWRVWRKFNLAVIRYMNIILYKKLLPRVNIYGLRGLVRLNRFIFHLYLKFKLMDMKQEKYLPWPPKFKKDINPELNDSINRPTANWPKANNIQIGKYFKPWYRWAGDLKERYRDDPNYTQEYINVNVNFRFCLWTFLTDVFFTYNISPEYILKFDFIKKPLYFLNTRNNTYELFQEWPESLDSESLKTIIKNERAKHYQPHINYYKRDKTLFSGAYDIICGRFIKEFILQAPFNFLMRVMGLNLSKIKKNNKRARRDILQVRTSLTYVYNKFGSLKYYKFLFHYNQDFIYTHNFYVNRRSPIEKLRWFIYTDKANIFIPNIYCYCRTFEQYLLTVFHYYTSERTKADYLRGSAGLYSKKLAFQRITGGPVLSMVDPKNAQRRGLSLLVDIYSAILFNSPHSRLFYNLELYEEKKFLKLKANKEIPEEAENVVPVYKLVLRFKKAYFHVTLLDDENRIFFSLNTGMFLKFFSYKKSLKKSKSFKILVMRYLRKLLLICKIDNFDLYVKQTSNHLAQLLRFLQKPLSHSFRDPLYNKTITEHGEKKSKSDDERPFVFSFVYIIFLKNKPYGVMKTKKIGRIKRKIQRRVMKLNNIID